MHYKCKLCHHNGCRKKKTSEWRRCQSNDRLTQALITLDKYHQLYHSGAETWGRCCLQLCSNTRHGRRSDMSNNTKPCGTLQRPCFGECTKTIAVLICIPKLKECLNLDQIVQNKSTRTDQMGMWYGLSRIPAISVISSVTCKEMHVKNTHVNTHTGQEGDTSSLEKEIKADENRT